MDLPELNRSLTVMAAMVPKKVGAALGAGADKIRDESRSVARGRGWSDDTVEGIYSRRERQGPPAGYVFLKGPAAYQETGTSRHVANPVATPILDRLTDEIVESVAERVAGIF